jgi:aryl-alcohol dehydrogenase-like predicted oxidoreductase
MRTNFIPALERSVSALGFGCASLGSRISEAQGRRALDLAFERGVTWYDVAPPYGDGQAEAILGRFIAGKRDRLSICTKVGIAPPQISPVQRVARPAVRALLQIAPGLRGQISKARPAAIRAPLDPDAIEKSVIASLRRLGVDHVDVLALHEPTPAEAADPRVWEQLEKLLAKGVCRVCGIAGSTRAIAAGALPGSPFRMAQMADNPFETGWNSASAAMPGGLMVSHSVLNGNCALQRLQSWVTESSQLASDPLLNHCDGSVDKVSTLLLSYALAKNSDGVVLMSMSSRHHINANCEQAAAATELALVPALDRIARLIEQTSNA